jgi:DNA-binding response OmpR family regulator
MPQLKVLLADDESGILEIMAKKVATQGYQVVTATNGRQAWDKIVSEDPDIILLDITMPEMTGLEILKKLRSEPPSKKWQPVIIVSALGEMGHIQEGLDLEADHYLTKPCSIENVIKAVRLMTALIPMRNQ